MPKTTLKDRVSGRAEHGTNPGPTEAEEKELESLLIKCSQMGYGKTRKQVLQIVKKTAILTGIDIKKHVSDGWYRRFKKRLPSITIRHGDPYANVCADCSNRETYQNYFRLLKKVLNNYNLAAKPTTVMKVACH